MIITFWRNFLGSRIKKPAWKQLQSVLSLGAFLVALALCADAQTTSSISGTVKDTTGAVIPGAKVVLINQASKAERSLDSNGEGFFYFAAVQPATYSIQISREGFETWKVTGISVHPGDNLTVAKTGLKVGAVAISIVVTADVAGVSLSSGEHSTLITSAQIQRISTVGRDAAELISMLPGFAMTGGLDNKGADYQTTGFGRGNIGSYGANGAAPQSGLVNIASDGANIIDPGDMGGQLANINMDQVEEVKIQTSNFGADVARGPIVVNAVGKSGGSDFHGSLYTYLRNYDLNANDWVAKHLGSGLPQAKYFYPGGTIGGPVLIPGTRFNKSKRLVFFTGYEYYGQHSFNSVNSAFVPNEAMMGGDLSADTLGKALGVSATDLTTNCPASYTQSETYSSIGGLCYSPTGGVGPNNHAISANGQIDPGDIDPAIKAYTRFWPKANHTPQPVVNSEGKTLAVSDGINYVKNVIDIENGFQSHSRVDLNISDSLKLYVTYNWEKMNSTTTMGSAYNYNVGQNNPLPTAFDSHTGAHYLTLNLTKIVSSSITNELVVSGVKFNEPGQYEDRSKVMDTGTAWESAGYSGGASPAALYGYGSTKSRAGVRQLPEMGFWEGGLPSFAEAYVPEKAQFLNKYTWSVQDNLTKVFRTHSIKVGFYADQTMDNEMSLGNNMNGTFQFMRWGGCYINQQLSNYAPINTAEHAPGLPAPITANEPTSAGTGNTIGQYLIGCPLNYKQDNMDPNSNMGDTSIEGYATDEWKVNSKLTLTFGIRLSHLTPWTDRDGIGMAVWDPSNLEQHVLYDLKGDPATWKGFNWHKQDSSIPMAGVPTRALFYSPRFSLAYDLSGNGKTVFRGGIGIYHSHDSLFYAAGSSLPKGKQTWDMGSTGTGCDYAQLFGTSVIPCGYYTRSTASSAMAPFSVSAQDPHDDRLPVIYNYNFTVDRSLPWKMQAELAYVGNQSYDLSTLGGLQNQNPIPLGAFFGPDPAHGSATYDQVNPADHIPNANDYRPYPNYQSINVPSHKAWANYNSMQASLNKQAGSLIFGLNYTWSKTMAVRGNWDTGAIGDPVNMQNDYGVASFDRPHVINASYSWQEGNKFHGNKILGGAINGWELSGITSWQAGPDLSVLNPGTGLGGTNYGLTGGGTYYFTSNGTEKPVSVNINNSTWLGSSDYSLQPILTCDPRSHLKKNQFVNGACFGIPTQGTQGVWNLPRIPGPAFFKWDMTITKHFKINDKQDMQIRLAGFNFLNHPITSFSSSDTTKPLILTVGDDKDSHYTSVQQALDGAKVINPNVFGITTFKQGERILELGFKYNF